VEPIVCAGAIVRDEAGRILVVRRANEPAAGLWSVPGGRVEPGETPAEAAAREVREETGLDVEVGEEVLVVPIGDYVVHDFAAVVTGGTLVAGDDAMDVRWVDWSELESLPTSPGLLDELRALFGA
jgi:8-oxo-dGTP diphosphatase